jgi:RNA polymerase sigma-70 factor (ECF subfamily)
VIQPAGSDTLDVPSAWALGLPETELAWRPTLDGAYRALAPAVLGYFRSHHLDAAEDLLGDVFVSVARGLRRFRGDADDFRRWVFTIARRRKIDHLRRLRVRRLDATTEPPDRAASDGDGSVAVLDVDLVAALQELTPLQRDVVVLRFVADLPLDVVARIVRRPTGAVKSLQARALVRLATSLDHPTT